MNVPQLRFSGFDEEWETFELKKLVKLEGGATPLKSEKRYWQDGHIPWVSSQEVGPKKLDKTTFNITEAGVSETSTKMVDKDTLLLVVRSGILARKIPLSITALPMAINQDIKAMIIKDKRLHHLFLYQWMKKNEKAMLSNVVKGGTTVQSVNTPDLQDYLIGIPSINEQYKIAGFFELIDGKIEKLQEKIEKLEQFKKGMMQKIFSQELRFKDEDLKWEQLKLRDVCTISSGKRLPKGHSFSEEGVPYISVSDMGEKYVNKASFSFIAQDTEKILSKYKVNAGDIIISIAGTLGKINLIDESLDNANLTENCNKITNFKDVINTYIYYCLKSEAIQRKIKEISTTSSQPKLALDRLRDFYIFVPSINEQQKISEFFIALDKKFEKEKEKLMVLEEQKKGFMQGMFV
ncbi:restriction endonuclease subunit S [Planococcus donghaensis]|uniref:restriction endonuclease subunit S n=1 Tax=Planococcus donghaensis TaxID=414778 RepID=UPI003736FEDE